MENPLDNDIKFVPGVGEMRARALEHELGIRTLGDMLRHYPFRYIDRTRIYPIAEITDAAGLAYVQFRARITGVSYAGEGRRRRFYAYARGCDGPSRTGLVPRHQVDRKTHRSRTRVPRIRTSDILPQLLQMAHPELETIEQALTRKAESGMQGIYPSTEKLGNLLGAKGMYQIICNTWRLVAGRIPDPLPDAMRAQYGLMPLGDAFYNIHFPQSAEAVRQAQYRLKFDELLGIQLNIQQHRTARLAKSNGFYSRGWEMRSTHFTTNGSPSRSPAPKSGSSAKSGRTPCRDSR